MHAMLCKAKQKKTQKLPRPKLCYHAKLHGKLPFMVDKLGLEPKAKDARLKLIHVKWGKASP